MADTTSTKISGLILLKVRQNDIVCLLMWCTYVVVTSKCTPWVCSWGNIRLIQEEGQSTKLAYILQKCQSHACRSMVISMHYPFCWLRICLQLFNQFPINTYRLIEVFLKGVWWMSFYICLLLLVKLVLLSQSRFSDVRLLCQRVCTFCV